MVTNLFSSVNREYEDHLSEVPHVEMIRFAIWCYSLESAESKRLCLNVRLIQWKTPLTRTTAVRDNARLEYGIVTTLVGPKIVAARFGSDSGLDFKLSDYREKRKLA